MPTNSSESWQLLQAWHFLRVLRPHPSPGEGKQVLGVVLPAALAEGLDTLAAYSARFISCSGSTIIWDSRAPQLDAHIDQLLAAGCLNLITPSGLHFGEGPFEELSRAEMAAPLVAAGTNLMHVLLELASRKGRTV